MHGQLPLDSMAQNEGYTMCVGEPDLGCDGMAYYRGQQGGLAVWGALEWLLGELAWWIGPRKAIESCCCGVRMGK